MLSCIGRKGWRRNASSLSAGEAREIFTCGSAAVRRESWCGPSNQRRAEHRACLLDKAPDEYHQRGCEGALLGVGKPTNINQIRRRTKSSGCVFAALVRRARLCKKRSRAGPHHCRIAEFGARSGERAGEQTNPRLLADAARKMADRNRARLRSARSGSHGQTRHGRAAWRGAG